MLKHAHSRVHPWNILNQLKLCFDVADVFFSPSLWDYVAIQQVVNQFKKKKQKK